MSRMKDPLQPQHCAEMLGALAAPERLQIIRQLREGPSNVTDLAEKNGTIVVAPYGRGYYDFVGVESDVYDALHAAEDAFTIDPRRHYLAGYSMGGFSVFRVAPVEPAEWSAVMSIAGSLLGSEIDKLHTMRNTPFYVLTGTILAPALWADPLGQLTKIIPMMVAMLLTLAIIDER